VRQRHRRSHIEPKWRARAHRKYQTQPFGGGGSSPGRSFKQTGRGPLVADVGTSRVAAAAWWLMSSVNRGTVSDCATQTSVHKAVVSPKSQLVQRRLVERGTGDFQSTKRRGISRCGGRYSNGSLARREVRPRLLLRHLPFAASPGPLNVPWLLVSWCPGRVLQYHSYLRWWAGRPLQQIRQHRVYLHSTSARSWRCGITCAAAPLPAQFPVPHRRVGSIMRKHRW
jgi:hypothetical protein